MTENSENTLKTKNIFLHLYFSSSGYGAFEKLSEQTPFHFHRQFHSINFIKIISLFRFYSKLHAPFSFSLVRSSEFVLD